MICYIGNYRDSSGYSRASLENILALDAVGADIIPRAVKMIPQTNTDLPQRILELEAKSIRGAKIDCLVQHNLPSQFIYTDVVSKNIGCFSYETHGRPQNDWPNQCKLVDTLIVSCKEQKEQIDYHDNVYVVPFSVDTARDTNSVEPIGFNLPADIVKFYTIAEFNKRKNLIATIAAYFNAFSNTDNVILIIKTNNNNNIKNAIREIKIGMKKYADESLYPKIIVITSHLDDKTLNRLHKTGDIFISSSCGESWCFPAIDALYFGNYCIASDIGAFKDYLIDENFGRRIVGKMTPCFGANDALPGLYTSKESWFVIDQNELSLEMTYAYLNIQYLKQFSKERHDFVSDTYNRKTVGQQLCKVCTLQ